ncbi:MAG: hypothetical protein ACFE0I_07360 [Elainellaceae cyanobacterium]
MTLDDITQTLRDMFAENVQVMEPDSWQVEQGNSRILVLLSEDLSWMRVLITIAPQIEAAPFLSQLLEANFDTTQETRYALSQGILWGVFQHDRESLTSSDFKRAIARLISLQQKGLSDAFNQLAETQILQIIQAAKQRGQSLEDTVQTLDRFYREGVMGNVDQPTEQRDAVLNAWRNQLQRLWNEE